MAELVSDWLLDVDLKQFTHYSMARHFWAETRLYILNPIVSEMVIGTEGRYRIYACCIWSFIVFPPI